MFPPSAFRQKDFSGIRPVRSRSTGVLVGSFNSFELEILKQVQDDKQTKRTN